MERAGKPGLYIPSNTGLPRGLISAPTSSGRVPGGPENTGTPVYCHYVRYRDPPKFLIDTGLYDEARRHQCTTTNMRKRGCCKVQRAPAAEGWASTPTRSTPSFFTHLHGTMLPEHEDVPQRPATSPPRPRSRCLQPPAALLPHLRERYLGIEPAYAGCVFRRSGRVRGLPSLSPCSTRRHSVGHIAVSVATAMGDILLSGRRDLCERTEPNPG